MIPEGDSSIAQAVEVVVDRGQRLINDSISLVKFDLQQMLRAKAVGWSMSGLGLLTMGLSWIGLMVAAGLWLTEFWAAELVVAAIAGVHLVAGILLLWRGSRLAKSAQPPSIPPRSATEPEEHYGPE